MFPISIALLLKASYFMLRLSGGAFPKPLNSVEEAEYIKKLEAGDISARNILIERNMRLVAHIIKKYYSASNDHDDLISIGTIGLIKGVNSFSSNKNVKLATYASRCIENEILMYLRSQRKISCEISLSETIDTDKDGNTLSLMDTIHSDDNALEQIELADNFVIMRDCIEKCLDNREREILIMRYGLSGEKPLAQREIATLKGISRSYSAVIIGIKLVKPLVGLTCLIPIIMLFMPKSSKRNTRYLAFPKTPIF